MALLDHTWALLGADTPASSLVLYLLEVRLVLTWVSLEQLSFLEGKITAYLRAYFPCRLLLLCWTDIGLVVAWTRLMFLFFACRVILDGRTHRVLDTLKASESFREVLSRSWHFET